MNQIFIVFKKELTEACRDYRTLGAALSYALFGPFILYFALDQLASNQADHTQTEVVIENPEQMPDIVELLQRNDVEIISETDSPHVLLTASDTYLDKRQAGRTATLTVTTDHSNVRLRTMAIKVEQLIRLHGREIAHSRLITRGVAPEVASPIRVSQLDTSEAGARGKAIVNMLLIFFAMAPFFASMSFAIDTLAGERERKSLHILLAQPIPALSLVVGKWAVAAFFGLLGTSLTIAVGFMALEASPLADLGISLLIDWRIALAAIGIMIPLVAVACGLQILLSIYARSYKEGQTYLTFLSFAPALVGFSTSFGSDQSHLKSLPIYAELDALEKLMLGLPLELPVTSIMISILIVISAAVMVVRRLQDDKLITDG